MNKTLPMLRDKDGNAYHLIGSLWRKANQIFRYEGQSVTAQAITMRLEIMEASSDSSTISQSGQFVDVPLDTFISEYTWFRGTPLSDDERYWRYHQYLKDRP